jgi:hypothetical protein
MAGLRSLNGILDSGFLETSFDIVLADVLWPV